MDSQKQASAAKDAIPCPSPNCCGGYFPVARMSDEPEKCLRCNGTGEVASLFTPGPWEAPRNGLDGAVYAPNAPKGTLWRICEDVRGLSDEEVAANACLIAAAPDLLAALQAAQQRLELIDGNDAPAIAVRQLIGKVLEKAVLS